MSEDLLPYFLAEGRELVERVGRGAVRSRPQRRTCGGGRASLPRDPYAEGLHGAVRYGRTRRIAACRRERTRSSAGPWRRDVGGADVRLERVRRRDGALDRGARSGGKRPAGAPPRRQGAGSEARRFGGFHARGRGHVGAARGLGAGVGARGRPKERACGGAIQSRRGGLFPRRGPAGADSEKFPVCFGSNSTGDRWTPIRHSPATWCCAR